MPLDNVAGFTEYIEVYVRSFLRNENLLSNF